jgi:hypothetical protein
MTTAIFGGGTTNLDALAVAGAADFGTPTYSGVAMGRMVLGTAQATTSGTSIDFTGIPAWAKRITVVGRGVSTSGTSIQLIQIGSGSVVSSGYSGNNTGAYSGAGVISTAATAGFALSASNVAANSNYFQAVLINMGGNIWQGMAVLSASVSQGALMIGGGELTLSGALDRIRLTTVNGTDTFDAGSVNILYEG